MDQIERIRKLVLVKGMSERQAAKELGVSRHSVRKALSSSAPPKYQLSRPRPRPVLGKIQHLVEEMLGSDLGQPKKQRHTARRIYLRLREEYGFTGSEPSVRRCVGQIRKRQPQVFAPLEYEAGSEAQVDFGEAEILIDGQRQTVQFFCMKLCYSRMPFVIALPHQRQEAFFEGHRQAFEFFGGVAHRLTYDNLKVAVFRILEGHNREEQAAFQSLKAHYLFDSHFCTPGQGNEKGQVENLVGYVRRNALVPVPQVRSLAELNAHLRRWCEREADRTVAGVQGTIGDRLVSERAALLPLPRRSFDCARVVFPKINRYAQVAFDTCVYSVPWKYAHRPAMLKAYVDRVEIWIDQECVAVHNRSYKHNDAVLNLDHYLEVFLQKPGALQYSIPFKQAVLPEAYHEIHRALRNSNSRNGDKEFVRVLMLLRQYPAQEVEQAITEALERGICHADGIRVLLAMKHSALSTPPALDQEQIKRLPAVNVPSARTEHYSRLLPKGGVIH